MDEKIGTSEVYAVGSVAPAPVVAVASGFNDGVEAAIAVLTKAIDKSEIPRSADSLSRLSDYIVQMKALKQ